MKKRALVLSGGGSKGAYTVGVVKALLEAGHSWERVAGVSVGALVSTWLAMAKPEDQAEAYQGLLDIWYGIKGNKTIYKPWAPWVLTYVWSLWKGGIYNMKPLRNILAKGVDLQKLAASGVKFSVGVVSLNTGKYKSVVLSDSLVNPQAVDWIWASTIFPVLFPPVPIGGEEWVDGGVRDVIPIKDVLEDNPDEVDIVITSPIDAGVPFKPTGSFNNVLIAGIRAGEIAANEVYVGDLKVECEKRGIKVNLYAPVGEEVNDDSFDFNPQMIQKVIQQGYDETKAKLDNQ
jgi:NTE family protein